MQTIPEFVDSTGRTWRAEVVAQDPSSGLATLLIRLAADPDDLGFQVQDTTVRRVPNDPKGAPFTWRLRQA